jgi:hypothetical protein
MSEKIAAWEEGAPARVSELAAWDKAEVPIEKASPIRRLTNCSEVRTESIESKRHDTARRIRWIELRLEGGPGFALIAWWSREERPVRTT